MTRPRGKWAVLAVLFVVLVAADQWTKFLAVERLTHVFSRAPDLTLAERVKGFYAYHHLEPLATEPHYVWRPVWRMNYVENPGAAWGLFRSFSEGFRNGFFTLVSIGAVAFIVHYYRKLREDQRYLQVALSAVVIGGLVVLAVTGALSLPVAVIAHELSEFVVIGSGLRMLRS